MSDVTSTSSKQHAESPSIHEKEVTCAKDKETFAGEDCDPFIDAMMKLDDVSDEAMNIIPNVPIIEA